MNEFLNANIKVIGVGGGGGNAIVHMFEKHIEGANFFCINTDKQALNKAPCDEQNKLQIGAALTKGLGAGANPDVGKASAESDAEAITKILEGSDMVFIAAGMGGGTGTGAAPVVAKIARDLGILTVAVVTKPFDFEGNKRIKAAEKGIEELKQYVDSIIIIPNGKLLKVMPKGTPLVGAFIAVNEVLHVAVKGVTDLITTSGTINVDFADIKTVMANSGLAMMGIGSGKGEDRAIIATQSAISSPLLEDIDISNASGLIVSIKSGFDITMEELEMIGSEVARLTEEDAVCVVGNTFDADMNDEIKVSVIATGLKSKKDATESKPADVSAINHNPKPADSGLKIPAFLRQQSQ